MRLTLDTDAGTLVRERDGRRDELDLWSREAFELVSEQWSLLGWNQKYTYTFSWFGRPIIQLPEDMIRTQEVLYRVRPDVIVETGIAHGGSLIYYASLCRAMNRGHVVGIDIEIRPHNREALERHELLPWITLIEGSSTDPQIVEQVKSLVRPGQTALVLLDSDHSRAHVLAELKAYHDLVTPDSYLVATDGVMKDLTGVPRGRAEWKNDNPCAAVEEFLREHPEFVCEQPPWPFNESELRQNITHWPGAWLRRRR